MTAPDDPPCTNTLAPPGQSLSKEHEHELLNGSGISREFVAARGYYTATRLSELPEVFSRRQRRLGLVVPLHSPDGKSIGYQLKPKKPRSMGPKYVTPAGSRNVVDVNPLMLCALRNTAEPLWITEGAKKVDALASWGRCAIGLAGVWNWLKGGDPLPCWRHVPLQGRRVYVAFDSDWRTNHNVQSALARLVTFLKEQGATVLVVDIPHEGDGKTAIDDYLAAGGNLGGKLEELESSAHPYSPTDITTERLSRDEKLHAGIQELQRRCGDMPTVKQGECTDQDTAWELIVRAGEIGRVVKDGIRVRVSIRTLALATGISAGAQHNSLRRLEANGFLRQDNKGRRPEQAGAYILLIDWRALGEQYGEKGAPEEKVKSEGDNEIPPGGVGECNTGVRLVRSEVPPLRWSQTTLTCHKDKHDTRHHQVEPRLRLGKKRAKIIEYLLESGGSAPIAELMKRFAGEKTRPRDFRRRTLAMLEGYRHEGGQRYETGPAIVVVEDGIVSLLNNWLEAVEIHRSLGLEIDREEMGVLVKGAATLQAERYERDRATFRNRQKKKTDPEQEMSPPVLWSQSPWSQRLADERAAQAVRYLAETYPECGGIEALGSYQDAVNEAAARKDWDGYVEALRNYMKAGRRAALAIRRGVA